MLARLAESPDAETIARIYNEGIEDRVATFETEPRSPADVRSWLDGVHPVVVVEQAGRTVAPASATAASRTSPCMSHATAAAGAPDAWRSNA